MNNYTYPIVSFIRFNYMLLRTLEYARKSDKYNVEAYKEQKDIISHEINSNSPLKNCLDHSGEAGKVLTQKINELLKLVYSDDSTIVSLPKDGSQLRVDYSQAITLFEAVLPIHEEIKKVIRAHIDAARKENLPDEPVFLEVIEKEEYYYRGFVNFLLLSEFESQFGQYNKARREANGQITAQSNFIQNDINRLVRLFYFTRENGTARNADYYEVIDPLFAYLEMTGGRRDLPQGKTFDQVLHEVKVVLQSKMVNWEQEFVKTFNAFGDFAVKLVNDLNEQAKKVSEGQTPDENKKKEDPKA